MEIDVRAHVEGDELVVMVENTGTLEPDDRPDRGEIRRDHGGLGLENLRRRLEVAYPGSHHFGLEAHAGRVRALLRLRNMGVSGA